MAQSLEDQKVQKLDNEIIQKKERLHQTQEHTRQTQEHTRQTQEHTQQVQEQGKDLDARVTRLERQSKIVDRQLQIDQACLGTIEEFMQGYKATHNPQETYTKAQELVTKFKEYQKDRSLSCPLSANNAATGSNKKQLGAAEVHSEIKLSDVQTSSSVPVSKSAKKAGSILAA